DRDLDSIDVRRGCGEDGESVIGFTGGELRALNCRLRPIDALLQHRVLPQVLRVDEKWSPARVTEVAIQPVFLGRARVHGESELTDDGLTLTFEREEIDGHRSVV